MQDDNDLLQVRNLSTAFASSEGELRAVDRVSFDVHRSEVVGLVGESGSGKTLTALSLMALIDPPGRIVRGSVRFKNRDLLTLGERQLRRVRGGEIAMIWQDPMASLNPVRRIGDQVAETIRLHGINGRRRWWNRGQTIAQRVRQVLEEVNMPDPAKRAREYPHQLSGGLQQRVLIGMALAGEPELLIADEPTTALDVTIQAQILELLRALQSKRRMSLLLITHDLGVVAQMCHRVQIMYAGRIVESVDTLSLFEQPAHPYTRGLLRSIPRRNTKQGELTAIQGMVPELRRLPSGCPFHPRCAEARPVCAEREPSTTRLSARHTVSCHLYD